jgi:hypothetical protein
MEVVSRDPVAAVEPPKCEPPEMRTLDAIAISSFSIVRAEHAKPATSVIYNCSSGTACLEGNASGSAINGLYGSSTGKGTHGVYGTSNWAGVTGYTSSTNGGSGVSGVSTGTSGSANGVYGKSSNGDGVYGTSSATGAAGVYGFFSGKGGAAIVAESNNTTSYPALEALGDKGSTTLFEAYNSPNNAGCVIDPLGNLTCSGDISGGPALRTQHRNSNGQHVITYASESAAATIEDVGTARMSGGIANVRIDPAFASVIDHKWYYVFLTPLGDTRGLYVSVKTPAAFQVRENERWRSSLAFDYRIVGHPLDAENDRLPLAPVMRQPNAIHPAQ